MYRSRATTLTLTVNNAEALFVSRRGDVIPGPAQSAVPFKVPSLSPADREINRSYYYYFLAVSRWSRAQRGTVCSCISMTCRGEWLAASVPSCWVSSGDAAWPAPKGGNTDNRYRRETDLVYRGKKKNSGCILTVEIGFDQDSCDIDIL